MDIKSHTETYRSPPVLSWSSWLIGFKVYTVIGIDYTLMTVCGTKIPTSFSIQIAYGSQREILPLSLTIKLDQIKDFAEKLKSGQSCSLDQFSYICKGPNYLKYKEYLIEKDEHLFSALYRFVSLRSNNIYEYENL